jgi:hypothetical protein
MYYKLEVYFYHFVFSIKILNRYKRHISKQMWKPCFMGPHTQKDAELGDSVGSRLWRAQDCSAQGKPTIARARHSETQKCPSWDRLQRIQITWRQGACKGLFEECSTSRGQSKAEASFSLFFAPVSQLWSQKDRAETNTNSALYHWHHLRQTPEAPWASAPSSVKCGNHPFLSCWENPSTGSAPTQQGAQDVVYKWLPP